MEAKKVRRGNEPIPGLVAWMEGRPKAVGVFGPARDFPITTKELAGMKPQPTFWSLFAGVGGFDAGLSAAGLHCTLQVERNSACQSVLRRHYPETRRLDDVVKLRMLLEPKHQNQHATRFVRPDWIAGGFPCQDVSVAGRRAGLAGSRSGLWYTFRRIIALVRPSGVLIENVPGLLSSNGGRDMGTILGALAQLGYGYAYRVLDAQWFGVPQRRRRVVIVGCLGSVRRASEILFESDGLPWDSPPSGASREELAGTLGASTEGSGRRNDLDGHGVYIPTLARSVTTREGMRCGHNQDTFIAFDERNVTSPDNRSNPQPGDPCHTLHASAPSIAYQCHGSNVGPMGTIRAGNGNESGGVPFTTAYRTSGNSGVMEQGDRTAALNCQSDPTEQIIQNQLGVRRLMPIECERLQGFPDDWTRYADDGKELADSTRYRQCGNAVAVPVFEWIGRRLMTLAP